MNELRETGVKGTIIVHSKTSKNFSSGVLRVSSEQGFQNCSQDPHKYLRCRASLQ